MTDQTQQTSKPLALVANGGAIVPIIPKDMDGAWRIVQAAERAGIAKKSLPSAESKMVAVLQGMEMGKPPMWSMRWIAVINGIPSVWGDGALAVAEDSGLMEDIEETHDRDEKGVITGATCKVTKKGRKTPVVRSFSVDDAKKAQLWGKQGPWSHYPQRMLQMRARAWALRDAGLTHGLSIAEEVQDYDMQADKQSDGSYSVHVDAPARPTRDDFSDDAKVVTVIEEETVETVEATEDDDLWTVVDEFGNVVEKYNADAFVEATVAELNSRQTDDNYGDFWENNVEEVESLRAFAGNVATAEIYEAHHAILAAREA